MKKGDKVKTWVSTQIGTVKKVLSNGRVVVVFKGSKVEYGHSCISPWQYNHVIQRS